MKGLKKIGWLAGLLVFTMGLFCGSALAEVTVYAEGAYTNSDLVVYLYADINPNPDPILSYGVKLTYDPAELGSPVATKNEAVWYMGTPSAKVAYMDPDTSVPGEIIFIGGKLDTSAPTAGVSGNRVLLGKVTFTRLSSTSPNPNPESFFDVVVSRGRPAPYVNFASTAGADLDDGVTYSSKVRQRGDVNADKKVDLADVSAARFYIKNPTGVVQPWMDCNADDKIDLADTSCIRFIIKNP